MNDQPNVNVEHASPFKNFCITIGELPTSYLESMSYYEMLVWLTKYLQDTVIPTVNNNADAVSELQTLFVQLENYVNNYFENLNVQEEINNKLDNMAESGQLTNLIKSYIDPIYQAYEAEINADITNQNTEITNFKSSVNTALNTFDTRLTAVASGSPLVASSTAGMTETDRIYVNTTDGKWYYYDGDSWEIGGTYQSSGIANGSVTFENLEEELQDTFKPNFEGTENQPTKNKIIDTDGSEIAANNYGYYEINVNPFDTYKIRINFPDALATSSTVRTMFKYNTTVISYTTGDSVPEREYEYYEEIINIPYNVNKLILNCGAVNFSRCSNYINKVENYKEKDISIDQLDDNLKEFFNAEYTEVTPTLYIDNAYLQETGTITSYSSSKIYKMSVNPNEIYKCTVKQIYTQPAMCLGYNNNTFSTTFSEATYTLNTIRAIKGDSSGYQFTNYILEIPAWCSIIYINKSNSDSSFKIEKLTGYKVDVSDISIPSNNPLDSKTLCFLGDSIMAATTTGVKGWVQLMAESNENTNFYNYGHDGYTIAKAEDSWSSRSIQNVLDTVLSEHSSTDYIVFQGGVNDYWGSDHGITLGNIASGYNPANFDRTSFSGGMEYIINYLYSNFPNAKIVYIVTHQVYASGFYQFMDRAKEICEKWSVPYIDLWSESNMNFQLSYMRNDFSIHTESAPTGDGVHPNLDGYTRTLPFIENALKFKI